MANQFLATSLPSNFPPTNSLWVGLSTTIPDQAGNNLSEPSGAAGYARQQLITASGITNQFLQRAPGIYVNTVPIAFPTATGAWGVGPIQCVCTFDALNDGNLLSVDTRVITPQVVNAYNPPPIIPAYCLRVGVNSGWGRKGLISEAAAESIAAYCFQSASNSIPDTYIALCSEIPLSSDTDISSTREILLPYSNTVGYARLEIAEWQFLKPGRYGNLYVYQFPAATGLWGAGIPAFAIVNGAGTSGGNVGTMLFAGLINPPIYVDENQPCPPFGVNQVQAYLGQ